MLDVSFLRRRRFAGGSPLAAYAANGVEPSMVADFQEDEYLGTIEAFSDFTESGTSFDTTAGARRLLVDQTAGDSLALPSDHIPSYTNEICFLITGNITYTATGANPEARFYEWQDGSEYIRLFLNTTFGNSGRIVARQFSPYISMTIDSALSGGTDVPFALAVRHTNTEMQVASAGTAVTASASTGIPDLSAVAMDIANLGVTRLRSLIIWNQDIGETGIEEATSPTFFT